MSVRLHIASILAKKYALSQDDAMKIYGPLESAVKQNQPTELSFEGLENCSTIFLRHTLGQLYLDFGPKVDEIVSIVDASSSDEILAQQIKRLKERAFNAPTYRSIFNQALGEA